MHKYARFWKSSRGGGGHNFLFNFNLIFNFLALVSEEPSPQCMCNVCTIQQHISSSEMELGLKMFFFRRCSCLVECHVFRGVRLFLFLLPVLFYRTPCSARRARHCLFSNSIRLSVRLPVRRIVYKRKYTSSNFSQYLVGASPGF